MWKVLLSGTESGVLNPRPQLLGFHMPFQPPAPVHQIKKHSEGQRKEVYYRAQT
jgi:hypothetical protein